MAILRMALKEEEEEKPVLILWEEEEEERVFEAFPNDEATCHNAF